MAASSKKPKHYINYGALSILVADDFSSFRNTVFGMLQRLGVQTVDTAGNAESVIDICSRKAFDIILCDYNLGNGKTGQHVLEELRFKNLLPKRTVFIIVSAEAARTIVMSAYDCEPNDYLMKPITTGMLQQRIDRILLQRLAFSPVYKALDAGDMATAIDNLIDLSLAEDRYSTAAQKWLGELFIQDNQFDKAERLYRTALEFRQLDWAKLGLARCKQARGEFEQAEEWLHQIVNENPLYLPAYDVLADIYAEKGDVSAEQAALQRAVEISPMSILRQKKLGEVALKNQDFSVALGAYKKAVKLGDLSCYGEAKDNLNYARVAAKCIEAELDVPPDTANEAVALLEQAKERYSLDDNLEAQAKMLRASIHCAKNEKDVAEQNLAEVERVFAPDSADIALHMDYVNLLISMGQQDKANAYLAKLQQQFAYDQKALEQLDVFLDEPASDANRAMVAAVNREGIDLYNQAEYDQALECFEKAKKLFPKHIGLQLNIIQTLVGKMRDYPDDPELSGACHASLKLISSLIDEQHPQFNRYEKLRKMAFTEQERV